MKIVLRFYSFKQKAKGFPYDPTLNKGNSSWVTKEKPQLIGVTRKPFPEKYLEKRK